MILQSADIAMITCIGFSFFFLVYLSQPEASTFVFKYLNLGIMDEIFIIKLFDQYPILSKVFEHFN